MPNFEVSYMGLKLNNPVIAGSSGLTSTVDKIISLEKAGVGAVVLKSLFEEQINYEAGSVIVNHDYPEAEDYIMSYTKSHSVGNYLSLIEKAKKSVSIPVIASINCVSVNDWIDFAYKIEKAGADGLELNVFVLPTNKLRDPAEIENIYYDIARKVVSILSIPVAIKISNQFTNIPGVVDRLYSIGIKGVVMFNRFYEPDIDIEKLKLTSADVFSLPTDLRHTLRWTAIVSNMVSKIDISASTGVHDYQAVVKQLLAGAKTVQVCSLLYSKGFDQIGAILNGLGGWMEKKGFRSIEEFRGRMSYRNIPDPTVYERSQFMKYFSSIS